ncbi:YjeF N-terminal domain-like protein [Tothia fuscella]|uniref:Enhancer of mRNA-decapping protein 3 n=1 Tax=Tothia fuscella TaxID=1048955 RepID=A0A9P4NJD3_9PEZI|nr:YjeF N-terminal domain-like protein [Tothia fuscella]
MAASFIGLTVEVVLKQGGVIQGRVNAIDTNTSSLQLHDVHFLETGERVGNWTIQGPQILELNVVDTNTTPIQQHFTQSQPPSNRPSIVSNLPQAPLQSVAPPQPESFVDPAILSFGRRPTVVGTATSQLAPQEAPSTPMKVLSPEAMQSLPQNISPFVGTPTSPAPKKSLGRKKGKDAAATLKAPFSNLDINSAAEQEHLDDTDDPRAGSVRRISLTKTRTGKPMDDAAQSAWTTKKNNRKKRDIQASGDVDEASPEVSRKENAKAPGTFRGKGWRQTPILQDQPTASSPKTPSKQALQSGNRSSKKQQALDREARKNGWGTGDATDIQDMPEFDFASNLSKFDKSTIFAQMRTEDTTADDELLVSHNRIARPGNFGGKNLHPTENVLDSPTVNSRRISTQDSDSDATFDLEGSARTATKRTISRASSKRPSLRQNSILLEDGISSRDVPHIPRSIRGGAGYAGSSSHPTVSSPTPGRFTPPESPSASQVLQNVHFRIDTSNRVCPTVTPGGMAAIEEAAEVELGLSVEVMNESAARGIAEVAMAQLGTASSKTIRGSSRTDVRPVAIVLVGNHRAGARALASARHLRGRGVKVLACIVGVDRKVELEREVRKQSDTLVKLGGALRGWADTLIYLRKLYDSNSPPELIVEALLHPGKTFDDLISEDQRIVVDMIQFINKSGGGKDATISVDIPSGLNGSTGEAGLSEGGNDNLQVRANNVVCLGAPRIGLLRALQRASTKVTSSPADPLKWQIWVVDIGVNKAWKQSGMASSRGVRFGNEWIVPLKVFEGAEDGRA